MSTLKCAKCGKTFGENEPVIGIAIEGKPEFPYCVQFPSVRTAAMFLMITNVQMHAPGQSEPVEL